MGAAAANALHHTNDTTTTSTTASAVPATVAVAGGLTGGIGGGNGNVRLPGAGSRFGYRGPVRPSSTDITGRCQKESNDNIENNNCPPSANNTKGVLVSNCK